MEKFYPGDMVKLTSGRFAVFMRNAFGGYIRVKVILDADERPCKHQELVVHPGDVEFCG